MKCGDCKFWKIFCAEELDPYRWGNCLRNERAGTLIKPCCIGVETYETFGCIQFEAKEKTA